MENEIRQFIASIIENPLLNLYEQANQIFGENVLPSNEEVNLVVQELAEIPTTKRRLIKDIVYLKTKYNIAVAKDAFMENTVILIDEKPSQPETL